LENENDWKEEEGDDTFEMLVKEYANDPPTQGQEETPTYATFQAYLDQFYSHRAWVIKSSQLSSTAEQVWDLDTDDVEVDDMDEPLVGKIQLANQAQFLQDRKRYGSDLKGWFCTDFLKHSSSNQKQKVRSFCSSSSFCFFFATPPPCQVLVYYLNQSYASSTVSELQTLNTFSLHARLNHWNIVCFLGGCPQTPFLVFEHCDVGTLEYVMTTEEVRDPAPSTHNSMPRPCWC
jgi:hypothetical protein